MGQNSLKNAQDEVRTHFWAHNRVQNLILIILEKKVKKMFIFDYFRGFLVFNTKNWLLLGIPISRQRKGIMLKCMFGWIGGVSRIKGIF